MKRPRPGEPDVGDSTLELKTLRTTVPMRCPVTPPPGPPRSREAPLCRTMRLRLTPSGPTSPCHPSARRIVPNQPTPDHPASNQTAPFSSSHRRVATRRQRGALAYILVVLIIALALWAAAKLLARGWISEPIVPRTRVAECEGHRGAALSLVPGRPNAATLLGIRNLFGRGGARAPPTDHMVILASLRPFDGK
jgi:hypothetical protein